MIKPVEEAARIGRHRFEPSGVRIAKRYDVFMGKPEGLQSVHALHKSVLAFEVS